MKSTCAEQENLRHAWRSAAGAFEVSRKQLNDRIGICPKAEFEALQAQTDQCWALVNQAREALDGHIRQHRCGFKNAKVHRVS